jgi:hypothetical protein
LRHCAASWKVTGSIPDGAINFILLALIEMITWGIFWRIKVDGA